MPLKMLWKFSAKNDILSWEITHDKVWCVMEDNRRFSDEEFDEETVKKFALKFIS